MVEPVSVAWVGRTGRVSLRVPTKHEDGGVAVSIVTEDGRTLSVPPPTDEVDHAEVEGVEYTAMSVSLPDLSPGYHRLTVRAGGAEHDGLLLSAPQRCFQGPAAPRWGAFLPLYAMRSERNWGIGDMTDLGELIDWARGLGADAVGTLPMLAAFLDGTFEPSPYAPSSRLFWNELYVDVERAPELARCREARELIASPEFRRLIGRARSGHYVDHRLVYSLKRRALEPLARVFWEREVAIGALEGEYARFRAKVERTTNWRYHIYVQQLMEAQLAETAGQAGLFLDMPLGVHPHGFDTWRFRDAFAHGVNGGSPPDSFFTRGQDWGFPPLHPERIREQEYRYPIACIRHLMRHASALRIDHVMWMRRMFWVPEGMPATRGVYVGYREEELYALLALESHRNRTAVVGEDLGTVPGGVRRAMARHGVHRMFVLQYELRPGRPYPLAPVPNAAQASLNTHDMPTFLAMWEGLDIEQRLGLGLIDEGEAEAARRDRERLRSALVATLGNAGFLDREGHGKAVMRAAHRLLASSPARMLMVNLEDLWGERRPQNVPGTGPERPNWVRKAARSFEEFRESAEVVGTLEEIDRLRGARKGKGTA